MDIANDAFNPGLHAYMNGSTLFVIMGDGENTWQCRIVTGFLEDTWFNLGIIWSEATGLKVRFNI